MDIPRPEFRQKRRIRTLIYSSVAGVILVGATIALSRLEPAAPSVPRESIWPGTVQKGEMLIQVRGTGNLVTREIRWIPAQTAGRVERIIVRPGTLVESDTVIVEMSNSDLVQQTDEARFALEAVQADLVDTDLRLKSQQLDQRAAVGIARADYEGARLRAEADRQLSEDGIVSEIDYRVSELTVEQLRIRLEIEEERLAQFSATMDAQLSGARARVDQARNLYQRRLDQVESLSVRAGVGGMLREIQVEEGQQVSLGSNIALVARPDDLMAELRISETQARDVQIGQHVDVDTRNGVVAGVVTRIDPAVQNGSVLVDVEFREALPRGARPDQSVDGTILIEQLQDVVYMGRPTYGQQDATIEIFKMEPDGQHAVRVPVRLGRTSVSDVQIVQGLEPGDEVILSDTTNWESYDRIRLN
ncbi:MAG TPA: HlyD family efflux transporter periplasmic adaptor subunit [Gammaproteobacteria bacterium]|nr:HlyD family efflux transporter periplasmic adaptor subunit [Gammaproteobacteria bacterium]